MKRNCFLFRKEWLTAMDCLSIIDSKEAYGFDEKDLLHAIMDYALNGKRLPLDSECGLEAMMELIYPQIDEGLEELRKDGTLIEEE